VLEACETWARGELCQSVQLVASELVANAVRHARSAVRLDVRPTQRGVLVEVADDSPRLPERRDPGLFDESGRGLWLVDAMAASWGVEREPKGKRVWAELTGP
jgi:anti-sigma regulatory factor (Ser/Thr protein kinase)